MSRIVDHAIGEAFFDGSSVQLANLDAFRASIDALSLGAGESCVVVVQRVVDARTAEQNRNYWGDVVRPVHKQTGTPLNAIHRMLKRRLLPVERFAIVAPQDERSVGLVHVTPSTRRLSRDQFDDYVEESRALVVGDWGIELPPPRVLRIGA